MTCKHCGSPLRIEKHTVTTSTGKVDVTLAICPYGRCSWVYLEDWEWQADEQEATHADNY